MSLDQFKRPQEDWSLDQLSLLLDEHHDRKTRIQRATRDITENSKKIHNDEPISSLDASTISRFEDIKDDITGIHLNEYHMMLTGAIQETVEAALFEYYLKEQAVMSLEDLNAKKLPLYAPASMEEYLLGIMDLTGELMRYAIMHISDSDSDSNLEPASESTSGSTSESPVVQVGRITCDIHSLLQTLDMVLTPRLKTNKVLVTGVKELAFKMKTFRASLDKVNKAVYGIGLRHYELEHLQEGEGGLVRS